jgi:serine phosphatase RsbU (regulator of sigma subunit)
VGVAHEIQVHEHETVLGNDDTLVVWTDGIVEKRVEGELFGEERLREVVRRWRPADGSSQLIDDVLGALDRFGGAGTDDDRALLIVRAVDD